MKPNFLKLIILVLFMIIVAMSFYGLKMKKELLWFEKINSVSNKGSILEKKQFDIFKVITIDKEDGYMTIENGETYEGMVFFSAGSTWSKKPIIVIGDSSTLGIGRLDTLYPNEDGSCLIKRRYNSNGVKNIFGQYIIDINGNKHTIPFRFGPFTVE